jgi:hypothetical protein
MLNYYIQSSSLHPDCRVTLYAMQRTERLSAPILLSMKRISILFVIVLTVVTTNAQGLKCVYPVNLDYAFHNMNIGFGESRLNDVEGAKFLYFDLPSVSFCILQSPLDKSQLMFSLNPVFWSIATVSNLAFDRGGPYEPPYPTLPHLLVFVMEQLPNFKIEVPIQQNSAFVFGPTLDYLVTRRSLAIRGVFSVGLKLQVEAFAVTTSYNWESIGYSMDSKYFDANYLKLSVSYEISPNPISDFIYYCGAKGTERRMKGGW